jgi:hypothetical protein
MDSCTRKVKVILRNTVTRYTGIHKNHLVPEILVLLYTGNLPCQVMKHKKWRKKMIQRILYEHVLIAGKSLLTTSASSYASADTTLLALTISKIASTASL